MLLTSLIEKRLTKGGEKVPDYMIVNGELRQCNSTENTLYHYGVPGMKWGVRKAKPVKSFQKKTAEQKYYESKLNKAISKGANPKKISKLQNELEIENEVQRAREAYSRNARVGKRVAAALISGERGSNLHYERMRAAGYGRIKSYLVSQVGYERDDSVTEHFNKRAERERATRYYERKAAKKRLKARTK